MILDKQEINEAREKAKTSGQKVKVFFTEDLDIEFMGKEPIEASTLIQDEAQRIKSEAVSSGSIEEASNYKNSGLIRIEAIHSGLTRNLTYYDEKNLKSSASTWLTPYEKPVLTHHNKYGEPIGRVKSAKYNKQSLLTTTAGCIELYVDVSDPLSLQKVKDGRYLTVSIGAETDSVKCSICGIDLLNEGWCDHDKGSRYNKKGQIDPKGELCYWIIGKLNFDEISFVNIPSDPHAMATGISESIPEDHKEIDEDLDELDAEVSEGVVPFQDLPLTDKGRSWDESSARKRIADWARGSDKDKVDWKKYKKAFLYFDDSKKDAFTGYKYPIADVVDGSLKAVPKAIYSAAAYLNRGDISSEDKKSMQKHLAKYYSKLGEEPPWKQKKEGADMLMPDGIPECLLASEELLSLIGENESLKEYTELLWNYIVSSVANENKLKEDQAKLQEQIDTLTQENTTLKEENEKIPDLQSTINSQNETIADMEKDREAMLAENTRITEEFRTSIIDRIIESRIALGKDKEDTREGLIAKLSSRSMESLLFTLQDLSEERLSQMPDKVTPPGTIANPNESKTETDGIDNKKDLTYEDLKNATIGLFSGIGYSQRNYRK